MEKNILARIYANKLATNLKDLDKEKVKGLKTSIKALLDKVANANKGKKSLSIIVNADDKESIRTGICYALGIDNADAISTSMLNKAVVSAMQNKFVASGRGTKVEGWSYSISTFLKSLNASLIKSIDKASLL